MLSCLSTLDPALSMTSDFHLTWPHQFLKFYRWRGMPSNLTLPHVLWVSRNIFKVTPGCHLKENPDRARSRYKVKSLINLLTSNYLGSSNESAQNRPLTTTTSKELWVWGEHFKEPYPKRKKNIFSQCYI